jgi:hypothetical protein
MSVNVLIGPPSWDRPDGAIGDQRAELVLLEALA